MTSRSLLAAYFDPQGPGAALAILDSHVQYRECIGLANRQLDQPITANTRFELASASKLFTAVAVLRLLEHGRLALNMPIQHYLQDLPAPASGRPIRIRDLLQHTSGLVDYLSQGDASDPSELSLAALRPQLPAWCEQARPGRQFRYCNTNFVLLAELIRVVSGEPYAAHIQRELCDAFDLQQTRVLNQAGGGSGIAEGYANHGFGLPQFVDSEDPSSEALGDGGISSSLADTERWSALLFEGEWLRPETRALMCQRGLTDAGQPFDYGLGIQLEGESTLSWRGHGGSWSNASCLIGEFLPRRRRILLLSNERMAPVERIVQRINAMVG